MSVFIMPVKFLIHNKVNTFFFFFSIGSKKVANFLDKGQERYCFVNLRTGGVQHPPGTLLGEGGG